MVEIKENATQKAMFIDGVCQGVVGKDGTPLSPYMKPIMERIAGLNAGSELLFLGGGLYVLPKWAEDRSHHVCVVENDLGVLSHNELILGPTVFETALTALGTMELSWFDFILLDIWPNDPKLYCADYFVECKKHLKKGGIFSMNYLADSQIDINAMGKLLAAVFPNVKMTVIYKDKEMKLPAQAVYFAN